MKKLVYPIFCMLLFCTACGDDEPPLSENIVGTWNLSLYSVTDCGDAADNIAPLQATSEGCIDQLGFCTAIRFSADGTGETEVTFVGVNEVFPFVYTIDENNNTVSLCPEDSSDCSTISIDGDLMTLVAPDNDCTVREEYIKQ